MCSITSALFLYLGLSFVCGMGATVAFIALLCNRGLLKPPHPDRNKR